MKSSLCPRPKNTSDKHRRKNDDGPVHYMAQCRVFKGRMHSGTPLGFGHQQTIPNSLSRADIHWFYLKGGVFQCHFCTDGHKLGEAVFSVECIVWMENSCRTHFSSSLPKMGCSFRTSRTQEKDKAKVQRHDKTSPRALSSRLNTLLVHDTNLVQTHSPGQICCALVPCLDQICAAGSSGSAWT